MKANASVWFEIYVQDMPRAKKFYEAVFQRELTLLATPMPDLEMWQFEGDQNSYGSAGALVRMQGVASGGGGTLVYFACKDCAVEAERVTKNGGQIVKPKMSIGEYGYIVLVTDTEGNMIGLHSM